MSIPRGSVNTLTPMGRALLEGIADPKILIDDTFQWGPETQAAIRQALETIDALEAAAGKVPHLYQDSAGRRVSVISACLGQANRDQCAALGGRCAFENNT